MQQHTAELEQKFAARRQELVAPIEQRVQDMIDGMRAEYGCALIFDANAQGSSIASVDKSIDLTQRVIDRLKAAGDGPAGVSKPPTGIKPPAPVGPEEALRSVVAEAMTAQAVADLVGGRLSGPGDTVLRRVRSLDRAGADELAMCTGRKYAGALAESRAGAVLVPDGLVDEPGPATRIVVADPSHAMFLAARALHPDHPVASVGRIDRAGSDPARSLARTSRSATTA